MTVLAGLALIGAWTLSTRPPSLSASRTAVWCGFLILTPLGLGAIAWMGQRWAVMVCVIYGTVGLALDVATVVQSVTNDQAVGPALLGSGISGALNFLLIVLGGRSFLDVTQEPPPPRSRPSSPPSPS